MATSKPKSKSKKVTYDDVKQTIFGCRSPLRKLHAYEMYLPQEYREGYKAEMTLLVKQIKLTLEVLKGAEETSDDRVKAVVSDRERLKAELSALQDAVLAPLAEVISEIFDSRDAARTRKRTGSTEKTQDKETQVEKTQSEETQSEGTQVEKTQSEETQVEETQSEETQVEETQVQSSDGKSLEERNKELERENQDLADKAQHLQHQLDRNSSNSSIPSSRDNFRGKVKNSRMPTDRPKGGQPGHDGHRRRDQEPTEPAIMLPPPDQVLANPDRWYKTGEVRRKKMVGLRIEVVCQEYLAEVYRNRDTKERCHASFPANCHNELNYDESIKALIFFLRNQMKVSEQNISNFFELATGGKLKLSRGMINGINEQFAARTPAERKEIFDQLKNGEIMYTDFTTIRFNGKQMYVMVCTDKKRVWYGFRKNKGEAAVKDSPYENFDGIGVHDHEAILIKHALRHQECLAHVLRYLEDAVEHEPKLTWHASMRDLIRDMIHTRNEQDLILTEEQIVEYERRYDEVLETGRKEYEKYPPGKLNREGYNLHKRLYERESYLRFLRDPRLECTNNISLYEAFYYPHLFGNVMDHRGCAMKRCG